MIREIGQNLREKYQLLQIRCGTKSLQNPFDDSKSLNKTFYFLKTSLIEVLKESLKIDGDIIGWGLDFGSNLYRDHKKEYQKQKPALLLSQRKSRDLDISSVYVAYSLFELAYLIHANKSGRMISTNNQESFISATYNPFYSKPDPDFPDFHQVFSKEQSTHCLCWIPARWDPDFTGENRRQGRILLKHLNQYGLVSKEEEFWRPRIVASILLDAWHSWIAALALAGGKYLPKGLLDRLPPFQRVTTSPRLLTYLTEPDHHKTRIQSLSTGKVVSYTPLRVSPLKVEKVKEEAEWSKKASSISLDAVEWWESKDCQGFITGQPGQGKTSLLHHLFKKKLSDCLDGQEDRLCIFVRLPTFTSYDEGIEWLVHEAFPDPCGIVSLITELVNAGKLLVFCDTWDQVPPDRRSEVGQFLYDLWNKNNRLTISTRPLSKEQLPQWIYEYSEGQEPPLPIVTLVPFDPLDASTFLKERNLQYTDAQVQQILKLFEISTLELYPLWLDLLATFPPFSEEMLTEVTLLARWPGHLKAQKSWLSTHIDKIERLAFQHIAPRYERPITPDYAERVGITPRMFEALKEVGWLIPTGFWRSEEAFGFIHLRLEEYLAARYIWREWPRLTKELFSREDGLLSQQGKEGILELAMFEGQRRGDLPKTEVVQRISAIAGEPSWTEDGPPYPMDKIRDPFLAGYLLTALEFPPSLEGSLPWVEAIDQFLHSFWASYFKRATSSKSRYWREQPQVLRAMLARIPECLFFEVVDPPEGDFWWVHPTDWLLNQLPQLQLTEVVLTRILNIMEQHHPPIWEDPKQTELFFQVLRHKANREKWQPLVKSYLEAHIKDQSTAFHRDFQFALRCANLPTLKHLLYQWATDIDPEIRRNSAESSSFILLNPEFIRAHPKFIRDLAERWLGDKDKLFAVQGEASGLLTELLRIHPELLTEQLARVWLQNSDPFVRQGAMDFLFKQFTEKELKFVPEKLFLEMRVKVPPHDWDRWCRRSIGAHTDLSSSDVEYKLKWYYFCGPLHRLLEELHQNSRKDFPRLLQILEKVISEPIAEAEAKECFNQLPFYVPEAKSFANKFLSAAMEDLELFLVKSDLYSCIARGDIPNSEKLQDVLQKEPKFLLEVLDWLSYAPNSTKERLKRGIKALRIFKAHTRDLLEWTIKNPVAITLNLLDDILQSEDITLHNKLANSLLRYSWLIFEKEEVPEWIPYLLRKSPESLNPQLLAAAALFIEFFPPASKRDVLSILVRHPHPFLRAIGLRIEAESSGINLRRVARKAYLCFLQQIAGRPLLTEYDDFSPEYAYLPRQINLGLPLDYSLLKLKGLAWPPERIIRPNPNEFYRKDYALLLERENFAEIAKPEKYRLSEWILPLLPSYIPQVFGDAPEHQWALRGLNEKDVLNLRTTLFYLEDILYQKKWRGFSPQIIRELEKLEQHSDPVVKSMAIFLRLGIASEEEKIELLQDIHLDGDSLHAIFWACGSRPTTALDRALKKYVKKFPPKALILNLSRLIPWVLAFPHTYKAVWTQLVRTSGELATNYLFRSHPLEGAYLEAQSELGAVPSKWPTVAFYFFYRTLCLSCEVNSYFPTRDGVLNFPIFDDLFKELYPRIDWSSSELDELTTQLANHSHNWIRVLGRHLRLTLGFDHLEGDQLLCSTPLPQEEQILFINHISKLSSREKHLLFRKFLEMHPNEKIWTIMRLRELTVTPEVLPLLKEVFRWCEEKLGPSTWETFQFGTGILGIINGEILRLWRKIAMKLLSESFEKTVIEFGDLLFRLPVEFLPRGCLLDLYEAFRNLSDDAAQKRADYLFHLLYPKYWYVNPNLWEDILSPGEF